MPERHPTATGGLPRTRLEQVLAQRRMTTAEFRAAYDRVSGDVLSERQAYRWLAGEVQTLPYARARHSLETMFDEPAARLLGPPRDERPGRGGPMRAADAEARLIAVAADRARNFLRNAEWTNVGSETVDQLTDDLRRLAVQYPQQPLGSLLDDITGAQAMAFELLDGRQRAAQALDLYLLAGVACGLMARVSHDVGASDEAMTQARAAYVCADNAGHDGQRSWARGLQALIAYWSGDLCGSLRYAERGVEFSGRTTGSSVVWAAAGRARALAAIGRVEEARRAVEDATDLRESVRLDELDQIGGLCTFSRPRQLYYSADAFAWCGPEEAERTEQVALDTIEAYDRAPAEVRAFGDEAGARCALAIGRIQRGEADGAAEAMTPVLALPSEQRISGITASVARVDRALTRALGSDPGVTELAGSMQAFCTLRPALPR